VKAVKERTAFQEAPKPRTAFQEPPTPRTAFREPPAACAGVRRWHARRCILALLLSCRVFSFNLSRKYSVSICVVSIFSLLTLRLLLSVLFACFVMLLVVVRMLFVCYNVISFLSTAVLLMSLCPSVLFAVDTDEVSVS
jgi:hypothetical protein